MAVVRQTAKRMAIPKTVFFTSWKFPGFFFLSGCFVPVFLVALGFFFGLGLGFWAAFFRAGTLVVLLWFFFVPPVELVGAIYFTEHTIADENIKGTFYLDIFAELFDFSIFLGFFLVFSLVLFGFKTVF